MLVLFYYFNNTASLFFSSNSWCHMCDTHHLTPKSKRAAANWNEKSLKGKSILTLVVIVIKYICLTSQIPLESNRKKSEGINILHNIYSPLIASTQMANEIESKKKEKYCQSSQMHERRFGRGAAEVMGSGSKSVSKQLIHPPRPPACFLALIRASLKIHNTCCSTIRCCQKTFSLHCGSIELMLLGCHQQLCFQEYNPHLFQHAAPEEIKVSLYKHSKIFINLRF